MRSSLSAVTGFIIAAPLLLAPLGLAQQESNFQPRFTSNDRDAREGFCSLRIRVDNVTDVIMIGDRVVLRTFAGRPAFDMGSQCSGPLPRRGVIDFDFRKTEGPGHANVTDSPDRSDGRLVIHVSDPSDGDHAYTLQFRWRSEHRNGWGDWDGDRDRDHDRDHDRGFAPPPPPSFGADQAFGICQAAVKDQIWSQFHFRDADFARVRVDEGRNEWIVGEAVARRHDDRIAFRFECSVDFREGRVRNVRVWERDRDDR